MFEPKPKYLRRLTSHEIAVATKLMKRSRATLNLSRPRGAFTSADQRPRTRNLRVNKRAGL